MRWKTFHRDLVEHAQVASDEHTSLHTSTLSPSNVGVGTSFPVNDQYSGPAAAVLKPADAVIDARDIEEALLREERSSRSQAQTEPKKVVLTLDSSPSFSTSAAASPYIGLPAPPRGPRKASASRSSYAHSARQQESSLRPSGAVVDRAVTMDPHRSSPSSPVGAVSSPTDASVPSIKDFGFDSGSSLRADVMNALNMRGSSSSDALPVNQLTGFDLPCAINDKAYTQDGSSNSTVRNGVTTQPQARPLLYRTSQDSRDSDFTHSSCNPASTIDEPRISISSTIYPSSDYDTSSLPLSHRFFYDHSADQRSSLSYSEADEPSISDVHAPSIFSSSIDATSEPGNSFHRLESPVPERPLSFASSQIDELVRSDFPQRPLSAASGRSSPGRKPALPTTPKPDFRRSRSAQPSAKLSLPYKSASPALLSKSGGQTPTHTMAPRLPSDPISASSLPPTTNHLSPQERADLIRKTRKLTQVLGQTPSPVSRVSENADEFVTSNCLPPVVPSRKAHPRAAQSVQVAPVLTIPSNIGLSNNQFLNANTAEKKGTLSPMTFRHNSNGNDSDDSLSPRESPAAQTPMSSAKRRSVNTTYRSPTIISAADSFMELSDGTGQAHGQGLKRFPSTYSLAFSLNEDQKAEIERRRKRERLAKLHRFLGSRVPTELILGLQVTGAPLPPNDPHTHRVGYSLTDMEHTSASKLWLIGKRRNSLASSDPFESLNDNDRMREQLSDKEKAVVVKRALKMEKMFGEQPPQDLFVNDQTRQATKKQAADAAKSAPTSPVSRNESTRNKQTRHSRPGTAESLQKLLGPDGGPGGEFSSGRTLSSSTETASASDVYLHYRSSLISLSNIVDNDDKKSLVELHEYINEEYTPIISQKEIEWDTKSSIRSERRRSLPSRASQMSLASQFTLTEPKTEVTPFEVRRRRAAKLSHFFGVSYRNLYGEVLDSIEMGVREEEGKGSLNAEEAKDLLSQLSKLKKRSDELS